MGKFNAISGHRLSRTVDLIRQWIRKRTTSEGLENASRLGFNFSALTIGNLNDATGLLSHEEMVETFIRLDEIGQPLKG